MKGDNFDNCNKQKMTINVDPKIIIKMKSN